MPAMKVFYDRQVDAAYIRLSNKEAEGVVEISEGVNLDVSQDGKIIKEKVTFCHYAMRAWPGSWDGTPALHGHSHGRMPELDILLSFDVGVDVWGYAPIPWEAILSRIAGESQATGFSPPTRSAACSVRASPFSL